MKHLIIHLSDMHLRENSDNPSLQKIGMIAKAIQPEGPEVDSVCVVVSGDVAYGGKESEYEIAKYHLTDLAIELKTRFAVKEIKYIFVAGNHDCDFTAPNSVRALTVEAIRSGKIPDTEMIECCCKPQAEFIKFRCQFPNGAPDYEYSQLHCEYINSCGDTKIKFQCYNTAWMSELKEQQGAIHVPDLNQNSSSPVTQDSDYVISVFHHPYNWMPSSTFRRFKDMVEQSSDLILTGHEHEADHYQKYSFKNKEVNEYLEGAVFQEHERGDRSGFHAVFVDLMSSRQKVVSFIWDSDKFVSESPLANWVPFKRGARINPKEFELSDEFSKWLEDPGASYQHPAKPDLCLSDIYVFPNLKQFEITKKNDFIYGALTEGRDVLKALSAKAKVLIFGRQQSGKTTLSKILFSDLHNKNLIPILISGEDFSKAHLNIEKFDKLVEAEFSKQYTNPSLPAFKQIDGDRRVLIVDDFDHAALNSTGRFKLLEVASKKYQRLIILADDIIMLEELAVEKEGRNAFADFTQFEIVQFGHLLRSKLITQWYSIGSEYDGDQMELGKRIHIAEQMVSTMLGKNYLPHYPVFILTLIQANESTTRPNSTAGTYGSLYEVIITQSLASKSAKVDLDTKMTYLSEIAHWMHNEHKKRITDEEWEYFHQKYCAKYRIRPSKELLKRDFSINGLFDYRDERFGFRHLASYYYFVARYYRDNITQIAVREAVAALLTKLYKDEHTSIWLFLTHLSKDPFLLETILGHSKKIYADLAPARFEEDVNFLQSFVDGVEKIVLKDATLGELKEERLRNLDAHTPILDPNEELESGDDETNEVLMMLAKLNLALRTLEVLGQLVKNFPGSLPGDEKLALVRESYSLGLRTVTMLFGLYKEDVSGFIDSVYDRLIEKHPDINDKEDLKSKLKKFMFWIIEGASFGMIKRISQAVGHSQLNDIYREVREKDNSNSTALIDIAIRLENMGFPEERLTELAQRFGPTLPSTAAPNRNNNKHPTPLILGSKNVFCERLLKQLVVEHFYLFPTRESTKQKVCAALQIEMQGLRQIEVDAESQRREPKAVLLE
jgi:hypothetical protein